MAKKEVVMTDAERELQWRAEDDARTLKRAHEIMMDKSRHSMAKSTMQKELKALQNAVGGTKKQAPKTTKAPAKKTTAKAPTTKTPQKGKKK